MIILRQFSLVLHFISLKSHNGLNKPRMHHHTSHFLKGFMKEPGRHPKALENSTLFCSGPNTLKKKYSLKYNLSFKMNIRIYLYASRENKDNA